jgi:hypothetical protein
MLPELECLGYFRHGIYSFSLISKSGKAPCLADAHGRQQAPNMHAAPFGAARYYLD